MDVSYPRIPNIETPNNSRIYKLFTKSKSHLIVLRLLISFSLLMNVFSCSRSPYQGSAAYDCEGGDRVILNERLFCVYTEVRYTREPPNDMGTDDSGIDQQIVQQGDMFQGESQDQVDLRYCPQPLPIAYRYETLTLCSDGEISNDLLEAVVATWYELYNETAGESDDLVIDMSTQDEPVTSDAGIGVIIDEEPTDSEEPVILSDMSMSED